MLASERVEIDTSDALEEPADAVADNVVTLFVALVVTLTDDDDDDEATRADVSDDVAPLLLIEARGCGRNTGAPCGNEAPSTAVM
jgi:hypothetical protein